jgi:hypothetical protein
MTLHTRPQVCQYLIALCLINYKNMPWIHKEGGSGCIDPRIINLGAGKRCVVRFML